MFTCYKTRPSNTCHVAGPSNANQDLVQKECKSAALVMVSLRWVPDQGSKTVSSKSKAQLCFPKPTAATADSATASCEATLSSSELVGREDQDIVAGFRESVTNSCRVLRKLVTV